MPGDPVAREVARALAARSRVRLRAFGTSMIPWIRPGDLLLIEPAPFAQICAGDVILYQRGDRLFIHRVLRRARFDARPHLVTKGDSVPHPDAPVSDSEFLGRVVSIERGRRTLRLDARGHKVFSRVLARLSPSSRYWFPLARAAKRVLPFASGPRNPPAA